MNDCIIRFDGNTLITENMQINTLLLDDYRIDGTLSCGPNLTNEQDEFLKELLRKYNACFSSSLKDLDITNMGKMIIELENSDPVIYRPYRMSITERSLVRDMVQDMLDAGIVRASSSPYASPIVLVKKKMVKNVYM